MDLRSWTRVLYWRRASIQDGQAPGDATVWNGFSRWLRYLSS